MIDIIAAGRRVPFVQTGDQRIEARGAHTFGGPRRIKITNGHSPERNETMSRPDHIMQFFAYEHLPPHLQQISQPFHAMAKSIVEVIPQNPERTVALRKLLESKDAAVRAFIAKDPV